MFLSLVPHDPPPKKNGLRFGCPFLAQYLLDFVGADTTVFVFRLFIDRPAWRRVPTREIVLTCVRNVIIVAPGFSMTARCMNAFLAHGLAPRTGRALAEMLDDVIEIAQSEQWRVMIRMVGCTLLIIPMD